MSPTRPADDPREPEPRSELGEPPPTDGGPLPLADQVAALLKLEGEEWEQFWEDEDAKGYCPTQRLYPKTGSDDSTIEEDEDDAAYQDAIWMLRQEQQKEHAQSLSEMTKSHFLATAMQPAHRPVERSMRQSMPEDLQREQGADMAKPDAAREASFL